MQEISIITLLSLSQGMLHKRPSLSCDDVDFIPSIRYSEETRETQWLAKSLQIYITHPQSNQCYASPNTQCESVHPKKSFLPDGGLALW